MNIKTFNNKIALSHYFGDFLKQLSLEKKGVNIALSGGSTPKAIFGVLSHEYKNQIDWSNINFYWGDERCVAPTHHESNFGMTREHLFDHVGTKADNIHRVKGELKPEQALEDYINTINENVPLKNGLPYFDLMILGMGDDGHTASIFPYQMDLWNSQNICEIAQHPASGQNRLTLTGKVINNSENIFFLVTGANKAEKVDEIINQKGNYKNYPAALVSPGKTTWLMDADASSKL